MKLENLKKTIEELNADTVFEDGESMPSMFDFTYKVEDNHVRIYDANEYYNIDYLENLNYELSDAAEEFGFKYEPITEDEVHDKLTKAIQKDLGKDKYLEWEDYVVMSVYF